MKRILLTNRATQKVTLFEDLELFNFVNDKLKSSYEGDGSYKSYGYEFIEIDDDELQMLIDDYNTTK
jgi:hypothetical protein